MVEIFDVHSSTWRAVKAWAEAELERDRLLLEASGLDQATTENLRGGIAKMRTLLGMAEPKPVIHQSSTGY
jgi:hypothetical protein